MALGVEVGDVVGALEIEAAEAPKARGDAAVDDGVEDGNSVFPANLLNGFGGLLVHRLGDVPGGDEADLSGGEFLFQALAEDVQLGPEELCPFTIAVHQYGVVVPADDNHVVGRVRQGGVTFVHGRTENIRLPLIGHTAAVSAPVVVLHVVFAGQFVVPGLFDGIGGVLDVAVAEDDDGLAVEWGMKDCFRRVKPRLR